MEEKLIIKNFGPIKSVSLDLKKILLFIGKQSSGKSTIAKLISIFRDIDFISSIDNHLVFFQKYKISNYFGSDTYFSYKSKYYSLHYKNGNFDVKIDNKYKSNFGSYKVETENVLSNIKMVSDSNEKLVKRIKSKLKLLGNAAEKNKKKIEKEIEILFKKIDKNSARFQHFSTKIKAGKLMAFIKDSVYIPSERIIISTISDSPIGFMDSNIALPKFLTEFGRLFENSRSEKKELDIINLNVKYKYDNGSNKIYYDDNNFVPLSESSSGIQTITPLYLVIESLSNKGLEQRTYIIEEPELNLYPVSQKQLVYYLIAMCTIDYDELVLTTHSPYVLSSLNNLLMAFDSYKKYKNEDIKKIIPQKFWINPQGFNAYYISNGISKSIYDKKNKLISENELDEISSEIKDEFYKLLQMHK